MQIQGVVTSGLFITTSLLRDDYSGSRANSRFRADRHESDWHYPSALRHSYMPKGIVSFPTYLEFSHFNMKLNELDFAPISAEFSTGYRRFILGG